MLSQNTSRKGEMPQTPPLYLQLEAVIIYICDVTTIVRGIAVCIALEVVPLRLQQSDVDK